MRKNYISLVLCFVVFLVFINCGCSKKDNDNADKTTINMSYLNKDHTGLVTESFVTDRVEMSELLEKTIKRYKSSREDIDYISPFTLADVVNCTIDGNVVNINMSSEYSNLSKSDEILVRAALVRTICQIDGIEYVSITVLDEPITDSAGNQIGMMTEDMFIDNEGQEINTYEEDAVRLYFASLDGSGLIPVNRTVRYNTSNSLARVVIDELIKGPSDETCIATVDKDTIVNSVNVTDGICYVDLSSEFLNPVEGISPELTIYSVVNSLVELEQIDKVKFSINGEAVETFSDTIDLNETFEMNNGLNN